MRKGNVFMLAYVIVLALTLMANIFFGWDGLDRIAMAATIAGCAFAFSDLIGWCASYTSEFWQSIRDTNDYVTSLFESEIDTAEEQNEQLEEILEIMTPYVDKSKRLKQIEEGILDLVKSNNEKIEDYKATLKKDEKEDARISKNLENTKWWLLIEAISMVVGVSLFFTIVIFDFFVAFLTPWEAIVTIVAFILIVLNYFLKECIEEYSKQKLKNLQKRAETCELKIKETNDTFNNLNLLDTVNEAVKRIKDEETLSEDTNNGR